jgi:GGDEF domain-containing protein
MEGQAWRTSLRLSRSAQASDPRECALDEMLATEQRRCERLGRPMSVVALAPDGDGLDEEAARAAGAALREAARGVDRVVRLHPLGFAVVLPCTTGSEAARAAARLRVVAERATGAAWSAGLAALPGLSQGRDALAAAARDALLVARRRGGGTVCQGEADRRRTRRLKVGPHLSGSVQAGGRVLRAGVHDLSLSGALVRLDEEIRPGARVVLTVSESAPRARVAAIAGRVVRAVRQAADPSGPNWRAAVAFDPGADALRRVADLMAALPMLSAEAAGA